MTELPNLPGYRPHQVRLQMGGTAVRQPVSSKPAQRSSSHLIVGGLTTSQQSLGLTPVFWSQNTAFGDRSFAKRQILRYDHGYAVESLPAQLSSVPLPLPVAARQPTAAAPPAESTAAPAESTAPPAWEADRSVPRWVANDRKVRSAGGGSPTGRCEHSRRDHGAHAPAMRKLCLPVWPDCCWLSLS